MKGMKASSTLVGMDIKKKRQSNFRNNEIELITSEVQKNLDLIKNNSSTDNIRLKKEQLWDSIAKKLTAISGLCRSGKEVRIKWRNLESSVKMKDSDYKRDVVTKKCNEVPKKVTSVERSILSCISNTVLDGIPGAADTLGSLSCLNECEVSEIHCTGVSSDEEDDDSYVPSLSKRVNLREAEFGGCSSSFGNRNDLEVNKECDNDTAIPKAVHKEGGGNNPMAARKPKAISLKDQLLETICKESEEKCKYFKDKNTREKELHEKEMEKLQLEINILRKKQESILQENEMNVDLLDIVARQF